MKKIALIIATLLVIVACNTYRDLPQVPTSSDWKVKSLPSYDQQLDGNPEAGLDYLMYGDYIGSGVPYEFFKKKISGRPDTVLNRTGENANIPYAFNVFTAPNGAKVVNGNCFTCHASSFNGKIHIGLGNSFSDYQKNLSPAAKMMNLGMQFKYKKNAPEFVAFEDFGHYFKETAPHIQTNQPGANPAFRLAEACMMHRDPVDLTYRKKPNYEILDYPVATDVPPLWNVGKKNTLYYTGIGRGDFTKLLFQASVLGIPDSTAARKAINNFKDVYAWLRALEPPKYPGEIDQKLAQKGEVLFNDNCSKCHGTYGEEETYPNKLVALDLIKTDTVYAQYVINSGIVNWYNNSWFANSSPKSWFDPGLGYVAPPLDGVWATAPYLHNGSVPTLDDLLNSKQRPTYWKRSGNSRDYDYNKVGWKYQTVEESGDDWTFDTTLPSYGNQGHYFGDKLSTNERMAVIEYLKTL